MKKINLRAILGAFVLAVVLTSCASTPKKAPATLTKTESRAFWRIDGTDKNGNPSTVYIQGTFHLGDERIFPLSEEVQQAFVNSDRYAGEISTQGCTDLSKMGPVLNAPNKDGKLVTDHLTEEEKAFVQMAFGENISIVDPLEPWQIKTGLNVLLFTNTGLSAEYGLDNNFIATLSQMGREWDGLDELQDVVQERRLAAARAPEHHADFAALHPEGNILQNGLAPVTCLQVVYFQDFFHCCSLVEYEGEEGVSEHDAANSGDHARCGCLAHGFCAAVRVQALVAGDERDNPAEDERLDAAL